MTCDAPRVIVQASGFALVAGGAPRSLDLTALRAALAGVTSLVAQAQGVRAGASIVETNAIARNATALEALARDLGIALEWWPTA